MNATDLAAIDELVADEKFALLERLWASLVRAPANVPVTSSHLKVVRERLADHAATPGDVVGLDDAIDAARARIR